MCGGGGWWVEVIFDKTVLSALYCWGYSKYGLVLEIRAIDLDLGLLNHKVKVVVVYSELFT